MNKKPKNLDRAADGAQAEPIDATQPESRQGPNIGTLRLKIAAKLTAGTAAHTHATSEPMPVSKILRTIFATLDSSRVHVVLLALDEAQDLIGYETLAPRGQGCMAIDPTAIFRSIVLLRAMSVIVAHNHPSGERDASAEDLSLTASLVEGNRLLDVALLDHIIYTTKGYTSLREVAPHLFR